MTQFLLQVQMQYGTDAAATETAEINATTYGTADTKSEVKF